MNARFAILSLMVALTAGATFAFAQQLEPRGSLDAVTVIPSTAPATAPATMPTNHPHGHAGNMPTIKTGAIRVLISQGTKDGPPIGKDSVTVQLFAKGQVLQTYQDRVNEKGIVEIHDLPLETPFQPIITVEHAGAPQQLIGPPMHKYQPAIEMDMKVYEVTAKKPAWTIGLRHVVVDIVSIDHTPALHVTEMLGVHNPTDRAWTGENNVTLAIPLPAAAADVTLGPGLAEAEATITPEFIRRGKTMLPGSTAYVFGYRLSVENGAAHLSFTSPADTTLFALYLPGDVQVEKTSGVTASAAHAEDGRQLLKARSVKAGETITIELSHIKLPPPPTTVPSIHDIPNGIHPEAKP